MNMKVAEVSAARQEQTIEALIPVAERVVSRSLMRPWRKLPAWVWKYGVGVLCTQSLLASVLIVGWTTRLCQRAVFKQWWKRSRAAKEGATFREFIESVGPASGHETWPNWMVRQGFFSSFVDGSSRRATRREEIGSLTRGVVESLWLNFKLGVQVLFNTCLLTLPGCIFMQFSWRYGWDNSFNKGYEQAAIGPGTGLFGIFLVILAMMYVPMAVSRQSASGNWRDFYDFAVNLRLIRRKAFGCLWLALVYFAVVFPVNILKVVPSFLSQGTGEFAQAMSSDPVAALEFSQAYYLWCGLLVFPAYVVVRMAGARLYASALLVEVGHGSVMPRLGAAEHEVLARLNLLTRVERSNYFVVRAAKWTVSRSGTVAALGLALVVWFLFVFQTFYVSEFLNYHAEFGRAWLNQPVVQLPYFKYIPAHLSQ
jgi:hypothetical protein